MHQLDDLAYKSPIAVTKKGLLLVNTLKFNFTQEMNQDYERSD